MKHVAKGESPPSFEAWKDKANADWQPTYRQLADPEKHDVHNALLAEQGWVCCYCGREINLDHSHIEHFRPQHPYTELELSFDNMHASCLRRLDPGTPLHCGHAKKNHFDENLFVDPQDPSCEKRFAYSALGQIVPTDPSDGRAIYMAKLLSLDSPVLQAMRSEAINKVLGAEFLASLNDDDLRRLRDAYRARDEQGKLLPFGHVIARYAEQYLPAEEELIAAEPEEEQSE
jgi:uncharacterized protein (TIGR02646 family)